MAPTQLILSRSLNPGLNYTREVFPRQGTPTVLKKLLQKSPTMPRKLPQKSPVFAQKSLPADSSSYRPRGLSLRSQLFEKHKTNSKMAQG